ncbi:MAG: hypothetical protein SX243_11410 [Acidobacteriota bacterium]|nr:hypothetical protein [Acidobacteriota bacterium]
MPSFPKIRTLGWLLLAAAWILVVGLLTARLAGLLTLEGRRLGRTPEALGAGSLVLTSTYFWLHNGLELLPSLAILLIAARVAPEPATSRRTLRWPMWRWAP